jgi:zinc protease
VSFFADPDLNPAEQEVLAAATTVLETSLRDILREELGQTYTVSVGLVQSYPQRGYGRVEVNFGAAPENIDAMTDRVLQQVRRLQQEGPGDDLTLRAKESAKRGYETALRQNGYWLRRLEASRQFGTNPSDILTRPQRIEAVSPASIADAFKKYFPLDRYTVVTLVPEPGAATPVAPSTRPDRP